MTNNIYFCVAIPRSGKSTYCNKWVRNLTHNDPPRVIVCGDDIRLALTGHRFFGPAEELVSGIKHTMIRSLFTRGFDIIVDGTHTTLASIRLLLEIDPFAKPIIFNTPIEVCKQRAITTNQHDLLPVIDRMALSLAQLTGKYGSIEAAVDAARVTVAVSKVV